MKYMLDTNIVVFAKNNRPEVVLERMRHFDPGDLCVSVITLAELEYGVFNSSNPERNQLALTLFLANIDIVPFDDNAAVEYGRIRAKLRREGAPIGANDLMIAAHAKSLGMTLVTNNTREFSRVEGLLLEDWAS
ncbi:MAG: type II toxin-antitoxin system VapC family toxin [Eggerthellaceae bacterium]|nr:type II toxin-antitoxin system VapC family toxin [Eggerthellaceae bacterium]